MEIAMMMKIRSYKYYYEVMMNSEMKLEIETIKGTENDPKQRKPDINEAKRKLNCEHFGDFT